MEIISQIIFLFLLVFGIGFFIRNLRRLIRNIRLGKPLIEKANKKKRLRTMALVAMGQSKMTARPLAGVLHILVYLGFVIINIEVLEIIIDGLLGTHRIFSFLGGFYDFLIASFEVLAGIVIVAVVVFWLRRNALKLSRFKKPEMLGFPKRDADYILYIECALMVAFLTMNGADYLLQERGIYMPSGAYPISQWLVVPIFNQLSINQLIGVERIAWWVHIVGILFFLNYLYYSKHLHIFLSFPNTYWAKQSPIGKFTNPVEITKEVKLMLGLDSEPETGNGNNVTFGAKDVFDLNRLQLMGAYSCTECGRCTSECPANITGKKLSPRKIMMDLRDRLEEVGRNIDINGSFKDDGKQLIGHYISKEEIWACTSCNACVEACPILIDPLSVIMDLRRYLVLEQSEASNELNVMMTNIENNGAPWPLNKQDRLNWKIELDS